MTQSKDDIFYDMSDMTLDLSDYTVDTVTIPDSMIGDITVSSDTTFDIITDDTIDIDWIVCNLTINIQDIERMSKHYPGLEKAWRNFKNTYDMCKQDYEGKKKTGEIKDDDIPF